MKNGAAIFLLMFIFNSVHALANLSYDEACANLGGKVDSGCRCDGQIISNPWFPTNDEKLLCDKKPVPDTPVDSKGKNILSAYALFSIDKRYIIGCKGGEPECKIPTDATLESCTFVSERFPFRDDENMGGLWCDLVQGANRTDIKEIKVDLSSETVQLENLRFKFVTFANWPKVKNKIEKTKSIEVPIGGGVVNLSQTQMQRLKNIVFDSGISNGITLNSEWSDLYIRNDDRALTTLGNHCGIRAKHFDGLIYLANPDQLAKLLPFLDGLKNGCRIR